MVNVSDNPFNFIPIIIYVEKTSSLVQNLIFDQMLKIYIIKFIDYFTVHWGESQLGEYINDMVFKSGVSVLLET